MIDTDKDVEQDVIITGIIGVLTGTSHNSALSRNPDVVQIHIIGWNDSSDQS